MSTPSRKKTDGHRRPLNLKGVSPKQGIDLKSSKNIVRDCYLWAQRGQSCVYPTKIEKLCAAPPRTVDDWLSPDKHESPADIRKPCVEFQQRSSSNEGLSVVSHYSRSPLLQFDSICQKMQHLTQVILIGQKTETLDGIENLRMLTELWVVEAQLKDASSVSQCPNLTKLMLYSNNLTKIPALGNLLRLKSLWLSGNTIHRIENLEGLPELRDLNLANNKLYSVGDGLRLNQKLSTLNIARNPIPIFEELVPLRLLRGLTSLHISDPVYGPAPIARLCNYRSAVLLLLPSLALLDGFFVYAEERLQAAEFYEKKIRHLRMVAVHYKEKAVKNVRETIQQSSKDLKHFRDCAMSLLQRKIDSQSAVSPPGHSMRDLLLTIRRWVAERNERIRLIRSETEVRTTELELELQRAGNVCFIQHPESSHLALICQDLLNRASCPARLGQYDVERARVTRVTQVCDRVDDVIERDTGTTGMSSTTSAPRETREKQRSGCENIQSSRSNMSNTPSYSTQSHRSVKPSPSSENLLLLLTNADRDLSYGSWPLRLIVGKQHANTKDNGVYVTNCLAAADMCWLKRLRIAKEDASGDGPAISERRRLAAIVRLPGGIEFRRVIDAGCSGHSEKCVAEDGKAQCRCRCRVYRISGPRPALMFLVEYDYEFKEGTWPPKAKWWRAPQVKIGPGVLNEAVLSSCIGKPKCDWSSVTSISAVARGISVMGEFPVMSSVKSLDLSFNVLGSLGSLYAFPNLRELDLRANNLVALVNMRALPHLISLDISWNNIRQIIPILLSLKKHTPALRFLMISYNPIEDVLEEDQLLGLASHYLSRLDKLDNKPTKSASRLAYPGPPHPWPSNQPHFPLNIKWRAECVPADVLMPDCYTLNASNRLLKALVPSEHWSQVQWADLSGNLLEDLDVGYIFNVMVNIEEICLARNVIQHLPLNTFQSSTKLIRLDLSNNFISSLRSLALYPLSSLRALDLSSNQLTTLEGLQMHVNLTELYVANNSINSMDIIQDTLRGLTELNVLDLHGNPFGTDRPLIKLALFHLKKLESLNGMVISDNDLQAARETFGKCLDRDALLRHFSWKDLSHLTELVLPRTGLGSVYLPGHLLPSLVSIDFSFNNLSRLWGLHDLPSLQTLNMADNQIKRLVACNETESLEARLENIFPSLTTLYLQNNGLTRLADLEMTRITELRVVFLQGNRLTDFSDIPLWVASVVMDRNKVSSISTPITKFDQVSCLTDLLLEGNAISKLVFVREFPALQRLFIARNRIHDEEELEHLTTLPKLKELTLQGNPVCQRKKHFSSLQTLLPRLARLDGHIIDPNFYLLQRHSYQCGC